MAHRKPCLLLVISIVCWISGSGSRLFAQGAHSTTPTDEGSIVITKDNQTIDLARKPLNADRGQPADQFTGRGIVVRGAKNVTIKNANIRGFKIAIYAEDAPGLTIENCDVTYNYRQHLKSTPQREDESDWLYGHENDKGEWMRYGAGIYLLRCHDATIKNCRARNGQNGICIVSSDRVTAVGNDMSFMSGWGLAMWRSNFCKIISNRFDYCVRGYSHGVYARGQDSTGILVYEQCSDNIFAYNHATHGGDGFFLYAGHETTQRTGEGGCNRNLVYMNDFSYAVANGIEATFSDNNAFYGNKLHHCEHGIWAGYSTHSKIKQNDFARCRNGVSIEHGRNNAITDNRFRDCERGVWLWWDDDKDLLASAYVKNQGGESRNEIVLQNGFENCRTNIDAATSENSQIAGNKSLTVETSRNKKKSAVDYDGYPDRPSLMAPAPEMVLRELRDARVLPPMPDIPEGKEFIIVDDWGPYDFKTPRVWPDIITGWSPLAAMVLGPPGAEFKVASLSDPNLEITPTSGKTPAKINISTRSPPNTGPSRAAQFSADVRIGNSTQKLNGTLLFATWTTRFYEWNKETDPRTSEDNWKKIISSKPFCAEHGPSLDYVWYGGGPKATDEAAGNGGKPRIVCDHFAVVANTSMSLPPGKWTIRTISDDGVRVFVDDRKVIDNWTWHVPTENKATLEISKPDPVEIRVEYFEIDGHAQLQLFLDPPGK